MSVQSGGSGARKDDADVREAIIGYPHSGRVAPSNRSILVRSGCHSLVRCERSWSFARGAPSDFPALLRAALAPPEGGRRIGAL